MSLPPLNTRLRKRLHRMIALAEDMMVIEVYETLPGAVMHGGTAIWRCYKGNRFSEDVDFYLPSTAKGVRNDEFLEGLRREGFTVEKFKKTASSVYGKFAYLGVTVRYEALFKDVEEFVVRPFETSDGALIMVNTLRPDEILLEKLLAYRGRRKVRDLYDIFFLSSMIEDRQRVRGPLVEFLKGFERPLDERELKALIISGSVPTVERMLEGLESWAR